MCSLSQECLVSKQQKAVVQISHWPKLKLSYLCLSMIPATGGTTTLKWRHLCPVHQRRWDAISHTLFVSVCVCLWDFIPWARLHESQLKGQWEGHNLSRDLSRWTAFWSGPFNRRGPISKAQVTGLKLPSMICVGSSCPSPVSTQYFSHLAPIVLCPYT